MNSNEQFLNIIKHSFDAYLKVGSSRSTAKLKNLHAAIANDLKEILGSDYEIKSQGINDDKEGEISGRYYDKKVDVLVSKNNKPMAGLGVKFVMRNYSQNSNNYFENMLGETANIRSKNIPYFQIFIIFHKVPYYKKGGNFKKYDTINEHNLQKYLKLSKDNIDMFLHTPNKTLLIIVKLTDDNRDFANESEFAMHYKNKIDDEDFIKYYDLDLKFDCAVVLNDYNGFIQKVCHAILAI